MEIFAHIRNFCKFSNLLFSEQDNGQRDNITCLYVLQAVITHNTSYKMTEPAKPEEKYYISIFIETNFFLLPYLRGSVTFPKNKPIALKDGVATRGHLSSKNNKLTYRYKVKLETRIC